MGNRGGARRRRGPRLANLTLLTEDLTSLPAHLSDFDYIIAHGLYSWVPALVRDSLFTLVAQRQSLENRLIVPAVILAIDGAVHRHTRLGGTLNFYYRKAA